MATEIESRCSICLDSWEEVSYILPCFHQFCYTCILRWAENMPECPLCKRSILSILHSVGAENHYMKHVIALSETPSVIIRQMRGDPRHPDVPDLQFPEAPQPLAAEGMLRSPGNIIQPEGWVMLLWDYPCLLDTLMPWVQPRLRQIFRNNQMEAALVENSVMDILTNYGTDEDQLVWMLGIFLQNHTVTFVQQLIHVAVRWCNREASCLLVQQFYLPTQVPPLLIALQDAPWIRSPTPPPLPWVGIQADTPLFPLPLLLACKEPQESKESVPGPSTSRWGSEPSPGSHSDPQTDGPAALHLSSQQEAGTAWVILENASGVGQTGIEPPTGACASPQRLPVPQSQLSK